MLIQRFLSAPALAYVQARFSSGGDLLGRVIGHANIMAGEVFTYVDDSLDTDTLLHFAEGDKTSRRASLELTAAFVGQLLRREPDTIFLVENATARPGDSWLEDETASTSELVIYGAELYHKAYTDRSDANVRDAIQSGESVAPPVVGVVAALPRDCSPVFQAAKVNVDGILARKMTTSALAVVVGAYDGEGYLIWQPGHGSRDSQ